MLIPTTEVKIKLNKNPKNSKLILNTFQEEEVVEEVATTATMTGEATTNTSEGEVAEAKEEDATKAVIHKPNDAQVHVEDGEGSNDPSNHVDNKFNFNFNCKPIKPFGGYFGNI